MTLDLPLLFFAWLWSRSGTSSSPSYPSSTTTPALPAGGSTKPAPPPWPQVVPEGLPPFPSSAWEYDEPPPAAVKTRAGQLVSQLWARGSGASKVEQTAGRWIAYQAAIVASGKKGVVAWRIKSRAPAAVPWTAVPARTAPRALPKTRPPPNSSPLPKTAPSSAPAARPPVIQTSAPAWLPPRATSPVALPVLTYGMGLAPKPPMAEVTLLQEKLRYHGFKLEADGRFGNATRMAVIEFQKRTGLAPNVSNDALLKRGFGAVKQATWAKLFDTKPVLVRT